MDINAIKSYLLSQQNKICEALIQEENSNDQNSKSNEKNSKENANLFVEDVWSRQEGGFGNTRVLNEGTHIERALVSVSHVFGESLPKSATSHRDELANTPFEAMGLSVVVHPKNPYVPTSHMNIRFFKAKNTWWFGGGFDLTPYYPFEEDCVEWHKMAEKACRPFGDTVYPRYKKWCDEYFYIKHRKEPRGIGGIFFDDLNEWPFMKCFDFIQSVGEHYLLAYRSILAKRKMMPFTMDQRQFQLYRRGRYVEFNLVYDRGTLFGLQTGGRVESILMSLPPLVRFEYDYKPAAGTKEAELYEKFLVVREWL